MKKINFRKILLSIGALIIASMVFFPVYLMVNTSFKTTMEYFESPLSLPKTFYLTNYIEAWRIAKFPIVIRNSIFITTVSVILVIILASFAAYPLARSKGKLSKIIFVFFVSGLMLPFQSGMVPLISVLQKMNLMNTFTGVISVYVATNIAFAVFLFTGYIKTLPIELDEAALIDGCSRYRLYWKVIFPLMKPVTATVAIITSLSVWNDFLINYLIISSADKRTLPATAFIFFNKYSTNWGYGFAVLVLSMLPLVILFLILQKHVVKGIAAGSVKG